MPGGVQRPLQIRSRSETRIAACTAYVGRMPAGTKFVLRGRMAFAIIMTKRRFVQRKASTSAGARPPREPAATSREASSMVHRRTFLGGLAGGVSAAALGFAD